MKGPVDTVTNTFDNYVRPEGKPEYIGAPEYDGLRRDSKRHASVVDEEVLNGELYDTRYETTKRGLKSRHAQMIALGGTIGTGLFVGSGETLATGGPALILIAFIIMTLSVYCVVTAITEIAAYLPVHGSTMSFFGWRYVSKSLGFAMGWLYWYSLGILVPYEITAAGLVIDYWNPPVNIAVWLSIMIVVIVGLNALPVRFYGETEFWFASLKVIMMLGLLILSFILFWGGGPDQHGILGFRYWHNPQFGGAVHTSSLASGSTGRFVAFLQTMVLAAFPFTFAPELIVATGGEMQSPRRNLPKASRRYFYRLIFFYVGSVLAIGVICPSNDSQLTSGGAGAGSSAFVVGIKSAGIPVLDSIINAGIIISAWSSGNSFLYLSSRSLYSLAVSGNAPRMFKACSKTGVPYNAVICSALFTGLAYLNCGTSGAVVFNWFVDLTNTSGFISWICCCIVALRFRKAVKAQNIEVPYKSFLQPYGAYWGIFIFTILTLINGFTVFFPSQWQTKNFLTAYIGIPVFLVIYFAHRIYSWKEPWAHDPALVDMKTGLDEIEEADQPPKPKTAWYHYVRAAWE